MFFPGESRGDFFFLPSPASRSHPLWREMETHFSTLVWKIPRTEKPGYSLRGCKESDMTEWWSTQKPRRGLGLWPLPPSLKPVMAVWVLVTLILTLLHPSSMCDGRPVWWKDHWPTWTAQDPLLSSSQLVKNLNSICSLHSPLPRTYQIYRFLGLRQGLVWRLWL